MNFSWLDGMTDTRTTVQLEGEIDLSLSLTLWNFRSIDIHPAKAGKDVARHVGRTSRLPSVYFVDNPGCDGFTQLKVVTLGESCFNSLNGRKLQGCSNGIRNYHQQAPPIRWD